MDQASRKALEEAGFRVGTVEEFVGLTDEESRMIELKVALARRIRELRAECKFTQQELAVKLKSSQSRVAKVEAADPAVSLDLMVRAYFSLGGTADDLTVRLGPHRAPSRRPVRPPAPNVTPTTEANTTSEAKAKTGSPMGTGTR